MIKEQLLEQIRGAAKTLNPDQSLTYELFKKSTNIPMSRVYEHFDSWSMACAEAGVTCGSNGPENLKPKYSKGKEHSLQELKRIAKLLNTDHLSKSMYDSQATDVKACTIQRHFGSWNDALSAAGLGKHANNRNEIDLKMLAEELLLVYRDLQTIPTIIQITRRSRFSKNSYTRKFGGYNQFKIEAIEFLLKTSELSQAENESFSNHLAELKKDKRLDVIGGAKILPHARGMTLGRQGFRGIANAPTYENEVVQLFGVVAKDLGFRILSQRPQFPDCEAERLVDPLRKRYKKVLIEIELKSSDFRKHNHPLGGCDIIICWEHDWKECTKEVIELKSRIRELDGWE
ncbi:MAG: homing endonuclease associated repeat-containing protein [Sumerlaeia bacterium]